MLTARVLPPPSEVFYEDSAPVTTLDQFYDYVTKAHANPAPNTCVVSPPIPMSSGGRWYVGRAAFQYDASADRWWFDPYDRISDYYATEDDAADAASWHRFTTGVSPP